MNSKICLAIIGLVGIALLSYPASAESGTITITNSQFKTWAFSVQSAGSGNPTFDHFGFDAADYNQISSIFINTTTGAGVQTVSYATPGRSTTFTITSCGSGGGIASYSRVSTAMAWYFTNPSTITCAPVVLSYSTNIFSDVTLNPAELQFLGAPIAQLTANQPVWVNFSGQPANSAGVTGSCPNPCSVIHPWTYQVNILDNIQNNYVITYQSNSNTLFTTSITKSGVTSVNTEVLIENATGTPKTYPIQGDNSFNNLDYQVVNVYGQGIALNMSTSTGLFERVIVNTTGSGLAPVTPPNASNPNAANCLVNCIETNKPTYNDTESVNIFGSFYPATNTTTSCLFFGFFCTDTTINTESSTGFVFIRTQGSTSPVKFLQFATDQLNNYNMFTHLNIGTYQAQLYGFAAPGSQCTNGIVYDFQEPPGESGLPLGCYYPHNITTFQVVNDSGNLSIVWQTKLSNSSAIYGDTVTVAWSNVTANDTVKIFDETGAILQNYNINQSTVSQIPVFIPLFHIGIFTATIYNGSNVLNNSSALLNVLPPGSVDINNSFGITMYWAKGADIINNPTALNWTTGSYSGPYNISILSDGTEVRRNAYTAVPGQSQTSIYTFGQTGTYVANFLDVNGTIQQQADIQISTSTSGVPGVTPGGTGESPTGNNIVGASSLVMNLPWIGLMLLIVVIFGLIKNETESGTFVFTVAIVISLEALFGLWQQWGIYITVLSWIFVGIFFRLNKTVEV